MNIDEGESAHYGPREQVFRETLLCRTRPEDRDAWALLTRMVFEYVDTHEPRQPSRNPVALHKSLRAAARDLHWLCDYLIESAKVFVSNEETGRSGRALAALARVCAGKLGRIARGLEWELEVPAASAEGERTASEPAEE